MSRWWPRLPKSVSRFRQPLCRVSALATAAALQRDVNYRVRRSGVVHCIHTQLLALIPASVTCQTKSKDKTWRAQGMSIGRQEMPKIVSRFRHPLCRISALAMSIIELEAAAVLYTNTCSLLVPHRWLFKLRVKIGHGERRECPWGAKRPINSLEIVKLMISSPFKFNVVETCNSFKSSWHYLLFTRL